MTAQTPERLIIDGKMHLLQTDPLYRLRASRRMELRNPKVYCTSNYRGYIGTWALEQGRLLLLHVNWLGYPSGEVPLPPDVLSKLLRAIPCKALPAEAYWFSGRLKVPLGRCIVYRHHAWANWYERLRVVRIVKGKVVRDRVVDTAGMLQWYARRISRTAWLFGDGAEGPNEMSPGTDFSPEFWSDDTDDDWVADWWPPDYPRPGQTHAAV